MKITIPPEVLASLNATNQRAQERYEEWLLLAAQQIPEKLDTPRRTECVVLDNADDVTDEVQAAAIELFESWYDNDEQIPWDSFWNDLETKFMFTMHSLDAPAARKIQTIIRNHKNNS